MINSEVDRVDATTNGVEWTLLTTRYLNLIAGILNGLSIGCRCVNSTKMLNMLIMMRKVSVSRLQ